MLLIYLIYLFVIGIKIALNKMMSDIPEHLRKPTLYLRIYE